MPRKLPLVTSDYEIRYPELPQDGGIIDWDAVFGAARPLRVEIGVGNSPFLIEVSRAAPDFNYLGFEYSGKRVLKFLKKLEASGLTNIRILRLNAITVLPHALRPGTVDRFYLNHPDPWPKRRHAKKRFVNAENAALLTRLLRGGGGISLRTDVPDYAAQMLEVLEAADGLRNLHGAGQFAPAPADGQVTPYEEKFIAAGRRIFYLEYRKG
jgi:tRNA (guanine-N7-)-methyltransferase